ncbi:MAG: formylglycine-generating enzyme family protein [Desulfobulbus sp.]|uniref:formylglycine-generating enzyme family protein n=1 Tax=Desulfobulbus sp. TaxID=895 RepID=UPI00284930E0|nr:formylglycine-generating enzyme family protein [Desulfobulbus sp.]MDR2550259.1 formylglycine-generating enzyme family protein [Desulfobulbus sp.]
MVFRRFGVFFSLPLMLAAQVAYAASAEPSTADAAAGMVLVPIKGGCFQMGDSVGDGEPNERPVHEVCVPDFAIGRFEVTNGQYRKFKPQHTSGGAQGGTLNDDNQPAVNVSWDDAVAYAKWLSLRIGRTYRLPTEAEWEYAARAGSSQSRFWGNNPDEACKYANVADLTAKKQWAKWTTFACDDGYAVSAPVGSFAANGYGLNDMLGNVWEWCEDVYNSEAYAKLPKDNPVYRGAGEYRVMRGGGWSNGPLGVRSSHRVGLSPDFGHHALGFRLVASGP